jgi:DNA polymerase-3 subunit chi
MAEIGFYHLTRTGADQALPHLLGRTLAAGQRALVLCGSPERLAALDAALWLCPDPDWLPHGTAESGHAELQPIWLAAADPGAAGAPNGARFLFLLDGAACARLDLYERVFDLFDGADEAAVQAARRRWAAARTEGHALAYWQQTGRGWERKAQVAGAAAGGG